MLVLAAEDRVFSHGEDMVLVLAAIAVVRHGVVDHEPVVHICIVYNQRAFLDSLNANAH